METGKHLGKTSLLEHSINTGGNPPVRQQPYRVPQVKRKIIEEEVQKMLVSNVIRPSSSPWASSVVLVHWEFNVLPFGLTGATPTCQCLMDLVLNRLHWTHCLV